MFEFRVNSSIKSSVNLKNILMSNHSLFEHGGSVLTLGPHIL